MNQYNYFYITIDCFLDGYSWRQEVVCQAKSEWVAEQSARDRDFLEKDIKEKRGVIIYEISKEDYEVLKKYLIEI